MSRIVESLYGKYGLSLNESNFGDVRRAAQQLFNPDDIVETYLEWSCSPEELEEGKEELNQAGIEVVGVEQPDPNWCEYNVQIKGSKQDIINYLTDWSSLSEEEIEEFYPELFESYTRKRNRNLSEMKARINKLNEARNPANDEVNAIIRKHLQHKSSIKPAEQKVLDKYGITYNADDKIFKGPNGKKIGWESEDGERGIWGPRASYTDWAGRRRKNWGYIDKQSPEYSEVDYANYLTKEADPDAAFYNQSKTERDVNLSSKYGRVETPSMQKANRPYSPEYKKIKSKLDQEQHWLDMQKEDQAEAENRYYKDLKRYRQALQRDIDRERERTQKFQADYDTVAKEMDDFRNSLPKRNKNESLNRRNRKRRRR